MKCKDIDMKGNIDIKCREKLQREAPILIEETVV